MSKTFQITKNTKIVATSGNTRNGFYHEASFYRNGIFIESMRVSYLNRTWEAYEYDTVISDLLDKMELNNWVADHEKEQIKETIRQINQGKMQDDFRTVSTIASLGDIFGKTKKESNDWKLRMLKARYPALATPSDWHTLSENEKKRRLDAIIKMMRE